MGKLKKKNYLRWDRCRSWVFIKNLLPFLIINIKIIFMYSLTTYKETILFYDYINKFHGDKSNLRTFNKKFQKLIITTKLTNINEKKLVFSFFMFEIFTLKKLFFNSKFLFTVKDGGFLFVKFFLVFFPSLEKKKKKKKKKS